MPKRLVKHHLYRGISRPADLARIFDVSERAMRVRLDALGLTETRRCARPPLYRRSTLPMPFRYERALA